MSERAQDAVLTVLIVSIFAGCIVALSGCSAMGGAVTVDVPVPVECREPMPERPTMPTEALRGPGVPLDTIINSARAELLIREGYEGRLRTALGNCTAPLKKAP